VPDLSMEGREDKGGLPVLELQREQSLPLLLCSRG
jgi:hypothetical protein